MAGPLYLATGSCPDVVALAEYGTLGIICGPLSNRRRTYPLTVKWAADNGCFTDKWDEVKWWSWLESMTGYTDTCLFATLPDVVGDAAATLARSTPHIAPLKALGYPVAFVGQDGVNRPPWDDIDCLFLGGSTEWKLGEDARRLAAEAKDRGLWLHMGRVNSQRRYMYAADIGCDSVDGTFLKFPKANLPRLLRWLDAAQRPSLFKVAA